jgi:hypothetical protein
MSEDRATAHGKQLKLDGRHLADCISDQAAEALAICLNRITAYRMTDREDRILTEFLS